MLTSDVARRLDVGVITLFPEMFNALNRSVTQRAQENNLLQLSYWNPRDYSDDKHRSVDDRPYGGGPGMLLTVQPLDAAISNAKAAFGDDTQCVYLSPQGRQINQQDLLRFVASNKKLLLVAGRYEGIDERVIEQHIDEQWSVGDLVLTGGELAAMVFIDALARLIPGVLGHAESAVQDSFMNGLLDCPHYTRPEHYAGRDVPAILLGGNHQAINTWRLKQALGQTWLKRPDLLEKKTLSQNEQALLNEFKNEY